MAKNILQIWILCYNLMEYNKIGLLCTILNITNRGVVWNNILLREEIHS